MNQEGYPDLTAATAIANVAKAEKKYLPLVYSVTRLLFLSMPIILGSVYSFLIFLIYPFIIAQRIKGEEAFLERELEDYCEYK